MTQRRPGEPYLLASVPNLRDLGGWKTGDDRKVQQGVVFRSTELYRLRGEEVASFSDLGVRTVYDLRTAAERTSAPDPRIEGVTEVSLDVLADSASALPANLGALFADRSTVGKISEALDGGRGVEMMTATYRRMVHLPSARSAYRGLFFGIAGEHESPSLFHCTTGKDRTGWAAAALLRLLGVDLPDVYQDYLLTNEQLVPAVKPVFDQFETLGGDPALLEPVLGVQREYLDAAFDEMEQRYSTVEGYFRDGLGLDDSVVERLREQLSA